MYLNLEEYLAEFRYNFVINLTLNTGTRLSRLDYISNIFIYILSSVYTQYDVDGD